MSTYIQGGAYWTGAKKTKGALKEALKADPSSVTLYSTSMMGPQFDNSADKLEEGVEFCVVGPDPHRKRDWYATVKKNAKGQVTCS